MNQWHNLGDSMSKGGAMRTTRRSGGRSMRAQGAVDAAAGVTTDCRRQPPKRFGSAWPAIGTWMNELKHCVCFETYVH
jgi:hypothetical protein